MKRWYRVRITARRVGEEFRRVEMVGDVEATTTRDAIKLAVREHRTLIDRCYEKRGRRYTAERLGTTEQLVNGG